MSTDRERSIFHAALDRSPGERPAFIAAACAGDPELARRIHRLLAVHERAKTEDFTLNVHRLVGLGDPKQIGPYRILERIGEGGMGVVYLAEQTQPLRRRVALKIIKLGMDTKQVIARFESERQALALMSHSNIARILDAGATEQGRPYFVMEYVPGVPLHRYCDDNQLGVDQRLGLFLQVCRAVEHAHLQRVIHRDLKPGNVIVTEELGRPVPKVIDFGIAKATNQRLTEHSIYTEFGLVIGTPEYMSPEQASMAPREVDHRTDVYSLGVILYELLVGVLPFDIGAIRWAHGEIARIVREVYPRPPSARLGELHGDEAAERRSAVAVRRSTSVQALRRQLRGDLDWITMKALEKDPSRRYSAASDLASDIERFLRHENVTAGPPSVMNRMRRFVMRPRITVLGVVGALGLLWAVVWAVIAAGNLGRAPQLPRIVVLPFDNLGVEEDEHFADGMTEQITSRIANISGLRVTSRQSALQYQGSGKSLHQIGEELGTDYALEGTVSTDRVLDGSGQVRITARLVRVSDDAQLWAEPFTVALIPGEIFQVQARVAEEVARALDVTLLAGEQSAIDRQATDNMEAYEYYMRGTAHATRRFNVQDASQAVTMFTRAVELDPSFAMGHAALVQAISVMRRLHERGDWARAEAALERALALAPTHPDVQLAAGIYEYYRRRDYDRAVELFESVLRQQPSNAEAVARIGHVRRAQGNWEEAIAALQLAVELDPFDHSTLIGVAETNQRIGRYAQAEPYYDRAIALAPDVWRYWTGRLRFYLNWDGTSERAYQTLREHTARGGSVPIAVGEVLRSLADEFADIVAQYTVDTWPNPPAHHYYQAHAWIQTGLGQPELARVYWDSSRVYQEARFAADSNYHGPEDLGFAYAGSGRRTDAIRIARALPARMLVSEDATNGPLALWWASEIYVMVGAYEDAITHLEELLSIPALYSVGLLKVDPLWDPIRDDPRFRALLGETVRDKAGAQSR